jgi:HK97 family phage major capsid protein
MHDVSELIKTKATLAGGDTLTGYAMPGAIPVRPTRLFLQDLMPQAEVSSNGIIYAQLTSMPAPPLNIPEGSQKTDAGFVGGHKQAKMRKAASWQKVSEEMYADAEVFSGFLNSFLALGLARSIERITIAEFITNAPPAIAAGVTAAAMFDAIIQAKKEIRLAGFEPDGLVISGNNFQLLRKDKGTGGNFHSEGPFDDGDRSEIGTVFFDRLFSLAVCESSGIADTQILVGAFGGGSQLFRRSGVSVTVTDSDQDDFIKNLFTVRIEQRNAVAVYALPAFRIINLA